MISCWASCLLLVLAPAGAIKFAKEGVTVPAGVLRVGESEDIVCNYIMWRQEQLHSVTWSLQYDGVKTDFFVYRANGEKEVTSGVSLIIVDSDYSEDKMVRVQLTDGRQDEVSLCCDVKVVRDDGYGQMTTKEKEKCSAPARVQAVSRQPDTPLVSAALESPPSGRLGDSLQLVCTGTGLSYSHRLQLTVGGRVVASQGRQRLEHQLTLHRGQFPGGWGVQEAAVSCLVVEGSRVIANSTRTIRLEEAGQSRGGRGPATERPQLSRAARLTDHHSEPGHPAHPASHPASIPCHAYLLLEDTRAGSLLSGRLSEEIKRSLTISRDTGSDRVETETAPAELLSLLGFHGHRVVGVGSSRDGRMVWTLERKYYEFHDEL